jgi:hypothetical protein
LPPAFQRIRYYGLLSNKHRQQKLALCRQLLPVPVALDPIPQKQTTDYRDRYEQLTGRSLRQCPVCKQGRMIQVEIIPPALTDTS